MEDWKNLVIGKRSKNCLSINPLKQGEGFILREVLVYPPISYLHWKVASSRAAGGPFQKKVIAALEGLMPALESLGSFGESRQPSNS